MEVTLSTSGGTENLFGTVIVSASPSPLGPVSSIQFYVDDVLQATVISTPYTYSWDTTLVAPGGHQLRVNVHYSRIQVIQKRLDVTVLDQTVQLPPLAPIQDVPVFTGEEESP